MVNEKTSPPREDASRSAAVAAVVRSRRRRSSPGHAAGRRPFGAARRHGRGPAFAGPFDLERPQGSWFGHGSMSMVHLPVGLYTCPSRAAGSARERKKPDRSARARVRADPRPRGELSWVHCAGDWRKDFVHDVARTAALGIRESFIYDLPRGHIQGQRQQRGRRAGSLAAGIVSTEAAPASAQVRSEATRAHLACPARVRRGSRARAGGTSAVIASLDILAPLAARASGSRGDAAASTPIAVGGRTPPRAAGAPRTAARAAPTGRGTRCPA